MAAMILAAALVLVMMGVAQVQSGCTDTNPALAEEICKKACACLCPQKVVRKICVFICKAQVINNAQQCRNYPISDLCGDTFAPQCSIAQTQSFCGKGCKCCGFGANNQTCIDKCKRGTWALVAKAACPVATALAPICRIPVLGGLTCLALSSLVPL